MNNMISVLGKIRLDMKETPEEDLNVSKVIRYVKTGKKPALGQIHDIKSKNVKKNL